MYRKIKFIRIFDVIKGFIQKYIFMEGKSLVGDMEKLDLFVREFWGIGPRGVIPNSKKASYFASMGTVNWIGFVERINECVESPSWENIRSFVEYYCNKRKVPAKPYLDLYHKLEDMGYSSVFKTVSMKKLYLFPIQNLDIINPFWTEIIKFFKKDVD